MKFDMNAVPRSVGQQDPTVGDVYQARGGRGRTAAWLVVAVNGGSCHVLGITVEGTICSTASYYTRYFAEKPIVGRCDEIADFVAPIRWTLDP